MDVITSFGRYTLDRSRNQLLEDGHRVRIGLRALDVLTFLVDRAGQVVGKDELIAGVWARTYVDECNLRTQIAALRRVLGDGGSGDRYLVTIPGQGYRFVAPVSSSTDPSHEPPALCAPHSASALSIIRPIGRGKLLEDAVARLARGRLLSIVGPGGIGKTTIAKALADQVHDEFPDGMCFFDIAAFNEEDGLRDGFLGALGESLHLARDRSWRDVKASLAGKRVLILLDSCEVAVGAVAALVEDLLAAPSPLKVIATSREALRAQGENILSVPPLPFPSDDTSDLTGAAEYPAVQLFIERAVAGGAEISIDPEQIGLIVEICRKLDGLPLAIELATGGLELFGVKGVAQRLDERFRLAMRGKRTAQPRHRTLRAMLDWSYDTLLPQERRLLSTLSVFTGTFTIAEAGSLCGDVRSIELHDVFASLIDKSLLHADLSAESECYYLHGTTRAYAREKLEESGRLTEMCRRHALHYCELNERRGSVADASHREGVHELPEIRNALRWCFSAGGGVELGVRLTVACLPVWLRASLNDECLRASTRALAVLGSLERDTRPVELRLLAATATVQFGSMTDSSAEDIWLRVLDLAEELADPDYQMRALWGLWTVYFRRCQITSALERGEQLRRLAEENRNPAATAIGERMTGLSLHLLGRSVEARTHLERSLREGGLRGGVMQDIMRFQFDQGVATRSALALIAWGQGFPDAALQTANRAVEDAIKLSHPMSLSIAVERRAALHVLRGEFDEAQKDIVELRKSARDHGFDLWESLADCLEGLLRISQNAPEDAFRLLERPTLKLRDEGFTIRAVNFESRVAEAHLMLGRADEAFSINQRLISDVRQRELVSFLPELMWFRGRILLRIGSPSSLHEAMNAFQESKELSRSQSLLSWELRAAIGMAEVARSQGHPHDDDAIGQIYGRFTEGFNTPDLVLARTYLRAAA